MSTGGEDIVLEDIRGKCVVVMGTGTDDGGHDGAREAPHAETYPLRAGIPAGVRCADLTAVPGHDPVCPEEPEFGWERSDRAA